MKAHGRMWLVVGLIAGPCLVVQFYLGTSQQAIPTKFGNQDNSDRKEKTLRFEDCETFEDHRIGENNIFAPFMFMLYREMGIVLCP